MGQQNSCKTLIEVHSTMYLMHPVKVLQLLRGSTCTRIVRPVIHDPLNLIVHMHSIN